MTDPVNPPPTPDYAGGGSANLPVAQSQDDKSIAMLAHLLGIFTGFLGPLIIWLIKKDQSAFIDDQGKEALNFQIFAIICSIGCVLTFCFPPVFILLIVGVHLTRIILSIMGTVSANQGVPYRYPVNLRLIK